MTYCNYKKLFSFSRKSFFFRKLFIYFLPGFRKFARYTKSAVIWCYGKLFTLCLSAVIPGYKNFFGLPFVKKFFFQKNIRS